MPRHNMASLALFAAAAVAVAAPVLAADKNLDKTFQVPAGGRLNVDVDGGGITVRGTDSPQVVVHMRAHGSEAQLQRVKMSAERTADGVDVVARHDGKNGDGYEGVEVTVEVPRAYDLELKTAGGNLKVRDLDGTINGRTHGGRIDVETTRGKLTMRTHGGGITVRDVKGPTEIETSGGSIVASRVEGALNAQTNGGSIRLERISGAIEAQTHGGNIDVELIGANQGIVAKTNAGSITLRIPSTTNAVLSAATNAGGVKSDLPIKLHESDKRSLRGTLNGGGPEIVARTQAGSITINAGG